MRPPQIPTKATPDLEVPELVARLRDVVYNLWWSWSPEAHQLFNRLAPSTWQHYRNPIDVMIDLGPESWAGLLDDAEFTRSYHALVKRFESYMDPGAATWFDTRYPEYEGGPFAYFSTEFGWHECLQIYSGGLGVLSGDHCKSASDLGIPFVGVGLMYKHGYFRQTIDAEGRQQHFYPDYDLNRLPLMLVVDASGRELHVPVEFPSRQVHLRLWKANVGRVPVLLLDSDLPINHPADRPITSVLYVQGREMRLCQEIVLGVGGALALEALGIEPAAWHMNEGHSALLALHRIGKTMQRDRLTLEQATRRIARSTLFSTHTPVPAGNEVFDGGMVQRYFQDWADGHGVDSETLRSLGRTADPAADGSFNLTALALRTSAKVNGVSKLHGEVANDIWQPLLESTGAAPIESVTNGVHLPSWIGPEIGEVLRHRLGDGFEQRLLEPGFAQAIETVPDHELWTAHLAQKRRMMSMVRERALEQFARHGRSPGELRQVDDLLEPSALTVGFARRFATYKRADLILRDMERLRTILLDAKRPVQFVFAGKAHPADRPGQELIRNISQVSFTPELQGRMVFMESYDMRIGRHLVQGVDLWLNTPRRPMEASGTSGMKAAINGVLNCSILDGWWCEGFEAEYGWTIGDDGNAARDEAAQDAADSDALYRVLQDEIVPCFFDLNENGLPARWIRRMKLSMARLSSCFTTSRMVREYTERFYVPCAVGEVEEPTGRPASPSKQD